MTDGSGVVLLDVTVSTADLRNALAAVAPHASKDQELPALARIRCHVDRENITVAATDRYTSALGLVSVWDHGPYVDEGVIDLAPVDVKKILAVFKSGKEKEAGDGPEWLLRIVVRATTDAAYVRITDVSGMLPGEHLELPLLPADDQSPNLPGLFHRWSQEPVGVLEDFVVSAALLGKFKAAAGAYDRPLHMHALGRRHSPVLVQCGESFFGAVMGQRWPETDTPVFKAWLQDWTARLPALPADLDVDQALYGTPDSESEPTDAGDPDA